MALTMAHSSVRISPCSCAADGKKARSESVGCLLGTSVAIFIGVAAAPGPCNRHSESFLAALQLTKTKQPLQNKPGQLLWSCAELWGNSESFVCQGIFPASWRGRVGPGHPAWIAAASSRWHPPGSQGCCPQWCCSSLLNHRDVKADFCLSVSVLCPLVVAVPLQTCPCRAHPGVPLICTALFCRARGKNLPFLLSCMRISSIF